MEELSGHLLGTIKRWQTQEDWWDWVCYLHDLNECVDDCQKCLEIEDGLRLEGL